MGIGKKVMAHSSSWIGGKPDQKWTLRSVWGFEDLADGSHFGQRLKLWNRKGEQAIIKVMYDFIKEFNLNRGSKQIDFFFSSNLHFVLITCPR